MPRGSGSTEIRASRWKLRNSRAEPKRATVTKSTYCNSRYNIIQRMGRSLIRSGYRLSRKYRLKKNSRVLDMTIAHNERPDRDIIMVEAPKLADTVSSLAQVADDYDWNIVEEELSYMMAALKIAGRTEKAPEPQYIELERITPPISRLPTTPKQEKEIKYYLNKIKQSRDSIKAREYHERQKTAHLGSLIDENVHRLREAGISDEEIYGDVDERAKNGRTEYCDNKSEQDVDPESPHAEHVEDVNSRQRTEIIYYKPRDPTENIIPKRIHPSAQCPLPSIWKDHLLAAHIPMRRKCKESTPLFKQIMTKKLNKKVYAEAEKVIECRDRVFNV